ncbi:MAG: DUF2855 family protein [Deltaproteobacteria bacterium]|nr:DUF2855 family protein [Deltaproteobacteria bacterium]
MAAPQALLTSTQDAATSRLAALDLPAAVPEGCVRVAVRRVSLTTNNVTYALFGERMQYWRFFPSGEAGWGIVPAWGYGEVVASTLPELAVGERLYGYWPLAECVDLQPQRVSAASFVDGAAHRVELNPVYNRYLRCAADPGYRAADESALAVVQPLFGTAFLLADFIVDNACFGAQRVVLSSASSKTAYATVWCLRDAGGPPCVALTSAANAGFVRRLGLYDAVLDYAQIESLAPDVPTVFCDFSGNASQRERLHRRLGDALRYSAVIGATQFAEPTGDDKLPGAKPIFFFAPDQARQRAQTWGAAELARRVGEAQRRFVAQALDGAEPWLSLVEHRGLAAGGELLRTLAQGRVDPSLGHVLAL